MVVVLELNKKDGIDIKDKKVWLDRKCFPIKVTIYNNKLRESERIIYIREKSGKPKMMIS